jgi:ABC-type branched-subunit amino acid transport system substrate-binding protein
MLTPRRALFLVATLALASLTILVLGASASRSANEFNVLFISANEGFTAPYSKATQKILETQIADWNAKGGILGEHVNLIVKDDAGSAANGATIVKDELSSNHINWIYFGGTDEFAAAPIMAQDKVMNGVIGGIDALSDLKTFPYTFGSVNVTPVYAQADMYVLMNKFHAHKVAFIYAADTVSDKYFSTFQSALKNYPSLKLVGSQSVQPTQVDTTPQLTSLRADKPDVLIVESLAPTYATILKDLKNLGWNVPVLLSPGGIADTSPPAAIIDPKYLTGMPCIGYRDSLLPSGQPPTYIKPFLAELHKLFGPKLAFAIRFYMFTWDAVKEIQVGPEGAKSTDPDKIRAYLESLATHYPSPNPFVQHLDLSATSHFPHDISGMDVIKCDQTTTADGMFHFDSYVPWPASMHVAQYPGQ